jgi:hypothetical protein
VDAPGSYSFAIQGGRVWIDHARCDEEAAQIVLRHSSGLFVIDPSRKPVLAVPVQEAASKDSEFIACEIECLRAGAPVVFVDLDLLDLSSA